MSVKMLTALVVTGNTGIFPFAEPVTIAAWNKFNSLHYFHNAVFIRDAG